MSHSLKTKAAKSLQWSALEVLVRQGIQLVFSVILARLLTPHDFGVMALMMVFVGISNALAEGGFGSALIQRKDPSPEEASSVFYFNLAAGVLVAGILAACAKLIADFFEVPVLQPVTWFVAVNVIIAALGVVHMAMLVKSLDFRAYFMVTTISTTLGGIAGVGMAFRGYGVWSLVGQSMVLTASGTALLWLAIKWRPMLHFRWNDLASMRRFGLAVMGSTILEHVSARVSSIVIGRSYSVTALGLYNRGEASRDMASTLITRSVTRVAFPVFSSAMGQPDVVINALKKTLRLTMYVNLPGMAALCVLAPELVPLIYGPQWHDAVPFLQILAIAGIFIPMGLINLELLKARGRSSIYFAAEMTKKILLVAAVLIASTLSIVAIAWSQVIAVAAFFVIVAVITGKFTGYGFARQVLDQWKTLLATVAMCAVVLLVSKFFTLGNIYLLAMQSVLGGLTYLAASWLLRSETQAEVLGHLWKQVRRK